MEEELATQPATQIVVDPRRLGQSSGLSNDDLADIFCILHPVTILACRATAQIADERPEHTINPSGTALTPQDNTDSSRDVEPGSFELAAQGIVSRDIALRLSADLSDPKAGWRFGRSAQRSDYVIGNDGSRKISNCHFRIYLKEHGIIMIEDCSTNGTIVEDKTLKIKDKENGANFRHVLSQGSIISVGGQAFQDDEIRFVVRIPQRNDFAEELFLQNLDMYYDKLKSFASQTKGIDVDKTAGPGNLVPRVLTEAPDIFARREASPVMNQNPEVERHRLKVWRGGDKYNRISVLGKGAFATVYLINDKYDGTCYAAKELEKRRFMKNGVLDHKVDMEMKIMSKIKHPHIVQYIEHIDWHDHLYLIMDYVPSGDLGKLILEKGRLLEPGVKTMAAQLLSALEYLHGQGITHRDIKPDNILIESTNPFVVKLTDFGLSKMVEDDTTFLRTFCGTLLYCAPEVYSEFREYDQQGKRTLRGTDKRLLPEQRYDQAVDIWSFAAVIFYSLSGCPPYPPCQGASYQDMLHSIMTEDLNVRPLETAGVSAGGISFVKKALQPRPERRPTIALLGVDGWWSDEKIDNDAEDCGEVDMIGDGYDEPELSQGTAQLRIQGVEHQEIENNEINESQNISFIDSLVDVPRLNPIDESQNSFRTGGSTSDDSFYNHYRQGNTRLFGEVNQSVLGSSGVIPQNNLSIPFASSDFQITNSLLEKYPKPPANRSSIKSQSINMDSNKATPPIVPNGTGILNSTEQPSVIKGPITAPSLLGAESMVAGLMMNSYAGPRQPPPDFRESMKRLRRSTDDGSKERPAAKKIRSKDLERRLFTDNVPPSVYWDPGDKSTWHQDYPVMTLDEHTEAENIAKSYGQEFAHGNSVFDEIVGNVRKARLADGTATPSRAQSEPAQPNRQQMMKRDERRLEGPIRPSTAEGNTTATMVETTTSTRNSSIIEDLTEVDSPDVNFVAPPRILAKFVATPDSVLPNIVVNVNKRITSWGRGGGNTIIHSATEDRVPKYAFKVVAWTPGFAGTSFDPETQKTLSFWISSKATVGIKVNGVHVPSHDIKHPLLQSKYWGEIKHGDLITVWSNDLDPEKYFLRFEFQCFYGPSSIAREGNSDVFNVQSGTKMSSELDYSCTYEEYEAWQAKKEKQEAQNAREQSKSKKVE